MSRVVELHQGWMSDPAFRQEFARLEEELKQLKAMARGRAGKGAVGKGGAAPKGVGDTEGQAPRAMSA